MAKSNLIAGLDMGSGKITALAAYYDQERGIIKPVCAKSIPCAGLRGGMVSDIKETSAAVTSAVNYLEKTSEQDLCALFIALRGEHLESFTNLGSYNISRLDKEIKTDDIEQARLNAESIEIKSGREIIGTAPQGFAIDRQGGIKNPEGMEGSLLEVNLYITTGLSSALNNLTKAITRPGYRIDGTFYGLMCLAENALSQEEKDIGSLIIDLGGETISIGLYIDGALRYSRDLPFGCDLITHDIARHLRTPLRTAQEIKEKYGLAFPSLLEDEENISVPSLDGSSVNTVKRSFLLEMICPRVQEFFEKIKTCIDQSGFADYAVIGILTGGGSLMPGMTEQCAQTLGLKEVRRGIAQSDFIEGDSKFFAPQYTTALSLVSYASKHVLGAQDGSVQVSSKSPVLRGVNKILKIIKNSELFGG